MPDAALIDPREFDGQTVVVTGVGRPGQVGEVVAGSFVRHGAHVVLLDRDKSVVDRAAELSRLGNPVLAVECDLTDPALVEKAAGRVAEVSPAGVSALVNMAGGYADVGPVGSLDPATWHKLITINLTTAFVTTRGFLPLVRQARGTLLYFAAAAALPGAAVTNMSAYVAAKGGVMTLMRAVASEERGNGIRANALAPQAIRTAQNLASMGDQHNYVERETVAAWVLWLCSKRSGPISGQAIRLG
jgi:NAD(P)-dependent dehydrogenase (short-subunit alcohol dehydrogenase family)